MAFWIANLSIFSEVNINHSADCMHARYLVIVYSQKIPHQYKQIASIMCTHCDRMHRIASRFTKATFGYLNAQANINTGQRSMGCWMGQFIFFIFSLLHYHFIIICNAPAGLPTFIYTYTCFLCSLLFVFHRGRRARSFSIPPYSFLLFLLILFFQ